MKKPLYRVLQRETVKGWIILDVNDYLAAVATTRGDAREKARELIKQHIANRNEIIAAAKGDPVAIASNQSEVARRRHKEENDQ